jgi:kynurenine formamidase
MRTVDRARLLAFIALAGAAVYAGAAEPPELLRRSAAQVPAPPWPAGDELGMANAIGPGTWSRCAWHLTQPGVRAYELSYVRSNTMPKSPFSAPYVAEYRPTATMPGARHAFNGEHFGAGAEPAQQGTQFDAIGHFAVLPSLADSKSPADTSAAVYYGGYTQAQVKPKPDSPLLRLGVEKAPPLVTTAVLLDAKRHANGGRPMQAGQVVTRANIEEMLEAQGLRERGVLPGDVVLIRTGWGERWQDPDREQVYYTRAPGLAYDAAQYLGERRIVAVGLDTPFIDAMAEGFLAGKAAAAPGSPAGLPLAVHHHMLTQMGIHHLENVQLGEIADAGVWTSCAMILPLRDNGAAGSPIRPVAIGAPAR